MRFIPLFALALSSSAFAADAPDLTSCFTSAAKKWNVPEELLRAVAKEETDGFHNIPDARDNDQDHMKVYGIMGLRNDPVLGRSLEEAAALTGRPVSELIASPCANIEGGAAVIASGLRRSGGNMARSLMLYWNSEGPAAAADGLHEIQRLLRQGSAEGNLQVRPTLELGGIFESDLKDIFAGRPKDPEDPEQIGKGGQADYPEATWDASANFDAGAIRPKYIVMHTTEGAFNGAVEWLKNRKSGVSAHYVIRKSDGYVKQLVRERDRAFHARCWNGESIGVELEGFMKDSSTFNRTLLNAAAKLVSNIAARQGIQEDDLHVIGHNFGESGKIKDTPLQNCNDHGDPGRFFPWDNFLGMLGGVAPAPQDQGGAPSCPWWKPWCSKSTPAPAPAPAPIPSPDPQPAPAPTCSWWKFWCR